MAQSSISFVLGIPAYRGQVHYGHVMQMMGLSSYVLTSNGMFLLRGLVTPESCSVDWARNSIVHQALQDKDCKWALMLDADTYARDARTLLRMLHTGYQEDCAVIAAPVIMRGRDAFNVQIEKDVLAERDDFENKVLDVDRVGTACMAINLAWLKREWPESPWFETKQLPGPVPAKVGEDIAFCDAVRAKGGRIVLDGRFSPHHVDGGRPQGT